MDGARMRPGSDESFVLTTIPKLDALRAFGHGDRDAVTCYHARSHKLPFKSMPLFPGLRIPSDERAPVDPHDQIPGFCERHKRMSTRGATHRFAHWYASCRVPRV